MSAAVVSLMIFLCSYCITIITMHYYQSWLLKQRNDIIVVSNALGPFHFLFTPSLIGLSYTFLQLRYNSSLIRFAHYSVTAGKVIACA